MKKKISIEDWLGGFCVFVLFFTAAALPCYGQAGAQAAAGPQGMEISASPAPSEVLREIDDPGTGDRWLLMRNSKNPGGPGRLVLVAARAGEAGGAAQHSATESTSFRRLPVIHAGDHLTVEEHTAVADAFLEARAINPAVTGAAFAARLAIGGRVVKAIALGPGRAALLPETEVQP